MGKKRKYKETSENLQSKLEIGRAEKKFLLTCKKIFWVLFFLNSCENLQVGTQINGFCYKRKLGWNLLSA